MPAFSLLLVAAVTAAVVRQGGYYRNGQAVVATVLALSFLLALIAHPWTRKDLHRPALWPFALLAAWTVVRGALAGDPALAAGTVALLLAVVAVVAVCRRTRDRELLVSAVLAVGALVAFTGWVGVLGRITPLAQEDQGVWRAATTLTYANAAAGLLAPLALLALSRAATRPRDPTSSMVSCLLLVGMAATLSRGGVLALAGGTVTLAVLLRPACVAGALLGPAAGATIAMVGLLPSVPAESSPRLLLGFVALVAGLAVSAGLALASMRKRLVALAVVAGMSLGAVAALSSDAFGSVGAKRLVLTSADRVRELQVALDVAGDQPIVGVGPGRATLEWTGPDGRPLRARYVHNEYVQVLAELGLVGLGLLIAVLLSVARTVVQAAAARSPTSAGAGAGLAALAIGSAFDFLWHVPAVPLVGALLLGLTTRPEPSKPTEKEQQPCE